MSTKEQNSVWQKTKTQHLIRYLPKGTFYAYFKVGGKPFRKSLRTHVYSVAKLRLRDEIAEQHELAEASANHATGKLTFVDVVEQYRARIESEPRLKPASRHYRLMTVDFILKSWPSILTKKIGKIAYRECADWQALEIASSVGVLRFATVKSCRAWVVTDMAHCVAEARRLDGQAWQHIGSAKSWTLPGGNKSGRSGSSKRRNAVRSR